MELEKFSAFLRQRRSELGMTQAELAQKLHVTDKAISRWERGKGYPEVTLLEPLAKALDLSLVELMQSRRIDGDLTRAEAEAVAAGVLEISQQQKGKPHWFPAAAGILIFLGIFAVGLLLSGFLATDSYILTRLNPDFTLNDGFTGWDAILDQNWTSMEHTAYENGQITGTTRFWNGLDGVHSVAHIDANGKETILAGGSTSGSYKGSYESYGSHHKSFDLRVLDGTYQVVADRMVWYDVRFKAALDTDFEFSKILRITYGNDTIGPDILKEELLDWQGNVLGWRQYNYGFHGPTKASDYDAQGNLLGYTLYTYKNGLRTTQDFSADGVLLETTESHFTVKDQLKYRETYDADGNLTGVEKYNHRFWERLMSAEGLFFLIPLWGWLDLSASMCTGSSKRTGK